MPMPFNPNLAKNLAKAAAIATTTIIAWEGYDPVARHFAIDPPGVITVCNGITNYDIPTLKPGMKFTKGQCEQALKKAIPKYTAPIDKCLKVEVSENTRAALYSAAYNLGAETVCHSSMVRKINQGNLQGGCDALLLYVRANGKYVQGLMNRRKDERRLCLT